MKNLVYREKVDESSVGGYNETGNNANLLTDREDSI